MSNLSVATSVPVDLLRKYDRPGPRYTSYPTAPIWSDAVGPAEYAQALDTAARLTDQPLAVYCHIPFCRDRCYYCGCNTCITRNPVSVDEYISILVQELDQTWQRLGERREVSLLHFGGGTPTFLSIEQLAHLLDQLEERLDFTTECEKSIEIDPRVTTNEQFDFLVSRGFNRVSLGVQDFDSKVQAAAGRIQPQEIVAATLKHCRSLDLKGINFDLIYGLPLQSPESFALTLDKTIAMRPDRLAVYSFAYLPSVKSNQSKIDPADLPSAETKYELFALAIEKFTAAGYKQIGMDHFALPDDELALAQRDGRLHRNFMGYTVQAAPEMIGLGMSSIGYVNHTFFQNHSKLDGYKNAVTESGFAVYRGMQLTRDDLIRQHVISSLMCNFQLSYDDLKEKFSCSFADYFAASTPELAPFVDDGFLIIDERGLIISELGRTFVRNIAMTFDAYLGGDGPGKKATFSRTI